MKLSNAKIKYQISGGWAEIAGLESCDVAFTSSGTRNNWDREGIYTTDVIDSIEVNFERGENAPLDALGLKSEIGLQWNNGAIIYQGLYVVNNKINRKVEDKTITYISFVPKLGDEITLKSTATGVASGVQDVEVNGTSVVDPDTGVANVNLSEYAKQEALEQTATHFTEALNNEVATRSEADENLASRIDTKSSVIVSENKGVGSEVAKSIEVDGVVWNLPEGGEFTQEQADWTQTDETAVDFIKNKPSNLVTTDDIQEITGAKNFTGALTQNDDPVVTATMLNTYATQSELQEGLATREAVGACYTKHESDEEFAKYRTSNDQDVIDSNLSTAIATETSNRQSVDDSIRTEVTNETSRATTAEEGLQAQITGLSGTVKVEVVATQPESPVNGTMYYIGTSNPYTVKLYTDNTWYEMGTTTVDLSGYARLDGTNTTFTGDINLDGGAITAGENDVVKKMANAVKVGDVSDTGVTVNTVYLKTKLDHAGITLQSNDDDGTATITAKNINLHGDNLTHTADGTAYNLLKSQTVNKVITLTQAEYEAIETKDPNTLYCVTDA